MEKARFQTATGVLVSVLMLATGGLWAHSPSMGVGTASAPIIINQNCTNLNKVPDYWIAQAKKNLRVGYSHTSHGMQPVQGMEAFRRKPGSRYYYQYSDWGLQPGIFFNDYWANQFASDLGHNGSLSWRGATRYMLNLAQNDRNVVIWSWCAGVSDNTADGIAVYLQAMNQLEQEYPAVRFVYMTGHLDGSGASGNLNRRNAQIRSYCRKNNKVLFDFAAIESFDPDRKTNYMRIYANDNCDYDSDGDGHPDTNWATNWVDSQPNSTLARLAEASDECAHSQALNCVLKGRAFWWMMARLAGWNGTHVGVVSIGRDRNASEDGLRERGRLIVRRTGPTSKALTVKYTVGGTATPGTDYKSLPGSVIIPAGASFKLITVIPIGDSEIEEDESVTVKLSRSRNYNVRAQGAATVAIMDND